MSTLKTKTIRFSGDILKSPLVEAGSDLLGRGRGERRTDGIESQIRGVSMKDGATGSRILDAVRSARLGGE
jgi:hypothetical protein